jgi:hypothetical protein
MNNPKRNEFLSLTHDIVKGIDQRFSIHDFRMTDGYTHINLIFDLTIPHDCEMDKESIKQSITDGLKSVNPNLNAVFKIEYTYSGRE